MFSLQTGIITVILLDVSIFVLICAMSGLTFKTSVDLNEESGHHLDAQGVDGTLFTLVTDGFLILMFLVKMVTGLFYILRTLRPPQMDYQYHEEFGKLKWHTRRIKRQRILFKNYAMIANVTSVFILIQTTLLFLVLYNEENKSFFRYGFLIFVSTI